MTAKLSTEWLRGLKDKSLEDAIRHDTLVLGRLKDILDQKLSELSRGEIATSSYENPAWAFKQAHANGRKAGLTEIRNLLSFLDQ